MSHISGKSDFVKDASQKFFKNPVLTKRSKNPKANYIFAYFS